jgi:hypothetical protein
MGPSPALGDSDSIINIVDNVVGLLTDGTARQIPLTSSTRHPSTRLALRAHQDVINGIPRRLPLISPGAYSSLLAPY